MQKKHGFSLIYFMKAKGVSNMNESKNNVPTMYQTIPAVAAMNHVPGFEPMKLLRRTKSRKGNEVVLKLALPYKKLWFRLAYPKGRIRLNALRITEQMAIYEAQVFLDRNDPNPVSSFTASCSREDMTVEDYIRAAQEEAMDEALSLAGFGPQFADVGMTKAEERYGSEIPLSAIPAEKMPINVSPAAGNGKAPEAAQKVVAQTVPMQPQTQANPVRNLRQARPVTGTQTNATQAVRPATPAIPTAPAAKTSMGGAQMPAPAMKSAVPQAATPMPAGKVSTPGTQVQKSAIAGLQVSAPMQRTQQPSTSAATPAKQPATPAQTVMQPQAAVQENLPVEAAREEKALPIPPAVQKEAATLEEDTLPVPPAVEMKKTAETGPVDAVLPAGQAPLPRVAVSEAQKAMQILQRNPVQGQINPGQAASVGKPEQTVEAAPAKYTRETPVAEILKLMTVEEAREVIVDTGTCRGWRMEDVAQRRPASLKYYLFGGYKEGNNVLLAAARILYDQMEMKKAG